MSHYLMGGSSTEDLKYRPNDLLFSEAIRRAADKKHEFFDFLPSGPDDPALVRFKTKWGAIAFDAHTLDLVTHPLSMALFNRIYRLAETRPAQRILRAYRGR
jgi:lipid II:glycine glycyltransferase (peptidoglycan interpeptide bridge formation enzyme)